MKYGFFHGLIRTSHQKPWRRFNDRSPVQEGKRQFGGLRGPYFIALSDARTGNEKPCKKQPLQGLLVTFWGERFLRREGT